MATQPRRGKVPVGVTLDLLVRAADARLHGTPVEEWARAEGWRGNTVLVRAILREIPVSEKLRRWAHLSDDKRRLIIMRILDPKGGEQRQVRNSTEEDA